MWQGWEASWQLGVLGVRKTYWEKHTQHLTLQATSTFMGLPPNSVGGELGPEDLEAGTLASSVLEEDEVSQRWRNRVTSSWSSIVFMCLMKTTQEKPRNWIKSKQNNLTSFIQYVISEVALINCDQLTWKHHWMTSSSWLSSPETFSSLHLDLAAPAGKSAGALWLWPTSAVRVPGEQVQGLTFNRVNRVNFLMSAGKFLKRFSGKTKSMTYLLLSKLQVRTGSMCEESDACHGCSHMILLITIMIIIIWMYAKNVAYCDTLSLTECLNIPCFYLKIQNNISWSIVRFVVVFYSQIILSVLNKSINKLSVWISNQCTPIKI